MTTKTEKVPTPRTLRRRAAYATGEFIDGHGELLVGWNTARNPVMVEARAKAHQAECDEYLAEKLSELA